MLITEMGVSDEAKNVIPLKFLRKIKNKNVLLLVNSIRGHTVYYTYCISIYIITDICMYYSINDNIAIV
jgi:hypothetical protein